MNHKLVFKVAFSWCLASVCITANTPERMAAAQSDQGCCSHHGGGARCVGTSVMCSDGQVSPSCTCKLPPPSNVQWTLSEDNGLLPRSGLFQSSGGALPSPLGWTCVQQAPHRDVSASGDAGEMVVVTCKQSLGAEVSLIGVCFSNRRDSNAAMMQVKDSLSSATFTLTCVTP